MRFNYINIFVTFLSLFSINLFSQNLEDLKRLLDNNNSGTARFTSMGIMGAPQIDSSEAARISTKARGRGGIILFIIQFFPQFLVFGYGLWGLQLRPYIRKAIWLWG